MSTQEYFLLKTALPAVFQIDYKSALKSEGECDQLFLSFPMLSSRVIFLPRIASTTLLLSVVNFQMMTTSGQ